LPKDYLEELDSLFLRPEGAKKSLKIWQNVKQSRDYFEEIQLQNVKALVSTSCVE
jgi:hypothetical protein